MMFLDGNGERGTSQLVTKSSQVIVGDDVRSL